MEPEQIGHLFMSRQVGQCYQKEEEQESWD